MGLLVISLTNFLFVFHFKSLLCQCTVSSYLLQFLTGSVALKLWILRHHNQPAALIILFITIHIITRELTPSKIIHFIRVKLSELVVKLNNVKVRELMTRECGKYCRRLFHFETTLTRGTIRINAIPFCDYFFRIVTEVF